MLYDVEIFFVDAFNSQNLDEYAQIINQLVNIVEQVNAGNIESNDKLMDWLARRFETKVVDKVSITITKQKCYYKREHNR